VLSCNGCACRAKFLTLLSARPAAAAWLRWLAAAWLGNALKAAGLVP